MGRLLIVVVLLANVIIIIITGPSSNFPSKAANY
jgi:hypothetical protein